MALWYTTLHEKLAEKLVLIQGKGQFLQLELSYLLASSLKKACISP